MLSKQLAQAKLSDNTNNKVVIGSSPSDDIARIQQQMATLQQQITNDEHSLNQITNEINASNPK